MEREYYRIANGKYNEEGSLVILKGITGYNIERVKTKNGLSRPMREHEFTGMFEKAAQKTDNFKITKIQNKNKKDSNTYLIRYKDKESNASIIVKINDDVAKQRPNLVTRYDNMCAANITYKRTNNAKKIAKNAKGFAKKVAAGTIIVTASAGALFGFVKGYEALDKYGLEQRDKFLEERRLWKQNEIDEKCSIQYNYDNDKDCLARQEGYASYSEKVQAEKEMEQNESRAKTR